MAYTDFIAAIDLGTSHLVGMVGTKNAAGALSVVAYEVENSATCIRRGCVYNVEETASKIKRLILKLENKLNGSKIGKVYVGVGGQSLRTIEHTVSRVLGTDGVVTDEIINELDKECHSYRPDMLDVLDIVSPAYYLDDKLELNPVGIPCKRIEAHYKLVVGRPSLRRYVENSIAERAKVEIANIVISPLALADAVLTEDEKDLGCALIGFGAGVTSLTVYKGGQLVDLCVIPLGGNLITKDITSLHLVESEAERVKRTYGSAIIEKDNDQSVQVNAADASGFRMIKLDELNTIVEARTREILENIYARLEATGVMSALGAGIVITGGGAALKNLSEVIREHLKMSVRYSSVRKGLVEGGEMIAGNPEYAVAIGLLLTGTQNCAIIPEPEIKEEPKIESEVKEDIKEKKVAPEPHRRAKKSGGGIFGSLKKNFDNMAKGLFDEEEEDK